MSQPAFPVIAGEGQPRILVEFDDDRFYKAIGDVTYDDVSAEEADGPVLNIIDLTSDATGTIAQTSAAHNLIVGSWVQIAANTSAPSINGQKQVVAIVAADKFKIDDVTTPVVDGTVQRLADAELNGLLTGMLIQAIYTIPGFADETTYAKITGFEGNKILVDGWTNGTPDSGTNLFTVNGWVIDLPYCGENKLWEYRKPDTLVHELYGGQRKPEERGYFYRCTLNYDKHAWGDLIDDLRHVFTTQEGKRIILIPRVDEPGFNYEVFLSRDTEIAIANIGQSQGHVGVSLSFIGRYKVADLPAASGYGTDYGVAPDNQPLC